MKTINDIYNLISECKIILEYQELSSKVLGIYHKDSGIDLIIINQSIVENESLHKAILAEELGHYFTSIGVNIPMKYIKYSEHLKIDKCEEKAIRWAANYLIPLPELIDLLKNPYNRSCEFLSDFFGVSMEFFVKRLEFLSYKQSYYKILGAEY